MSQDEVIILLFKILLTCGVVSVAVFVTVYSVLAPWWSNPIGRTIVTLDVLLGCAFVPSLLSLFFHFSRLTSHVAAWIDVAIFALICAALLHRSVLWVHLHRRGQDETARPEQEETDVH